MISKELVGASARPILLSVLARGESYGYAIMQNMHELSNGEIAWKDGTLYPVLHRLEDAGFVTSRWGESESGRRRKYYAITAKGRSALEEEKQQWLRVDAILAQLWGLQPRLALG